MEMTKLTIRIPVDVLEQAKQYAETNHTSVTRLVSQYLSQLPIEKDFLKDAPIVRRLLGTLPSDVSMHRSSAIAHTQLIDLLQFLRIAAVDARVIEQALALPYNDFEDAVQMMAGVHAGVEYVVARDLRGFKAGPLPALSPGELIALVRGQES